ncbi:MAG: acetate--CoA ligase family protein [Deltaproteobacteria bacterium]|nr:acetate--CoA ligase family protein [Deltaproteobacteria bacterium]
MSDINDLESLFCPRSVAVVGASNRFGKWGFNLASTLLVSPYRGPVYLVNPRERRVLGRRAYASLAELPEKVDLVVLATPADRSISLIGECGRNGITNALVVASNFREVGEAGAQLEARLVEAAREHGVRLIGPNTMGMVSTPVGLEILFMPLGVKPGWVDVVSQSGNIGLQIMELSMKEGIGICRFVGSGNEAVLSLADYITYMGSDSRSRVVVLYIEGIRLGEKFLEAAARVSRSKPILVLKAGKTTRGAQAARSHSGAVAQSPQMVSDLLRQAGMVEAQSTEELIDLVKTFTLLKPPEGNRLGVVTLGGGWGVATTDAAALKGVPLATLSPPLIEKLDAVLPPFWSRANPLDLAGTTNRRAHLEVLKLLSASGEVDALVVLGMLAGMQKFLGQLARWKWIFLKHYLFEFLGLPFRLFSGGPDRPQESTPKAREKSTSGGFQLNEFRIWADGPFMKEIKKIMKRDEKPILLVTYLPGTAVQMTRRFRQPIFGNPERAVGAMSGLMEYGRFRTQAGQGLLDPPPPAPLKRGLEDEVGSFKNLDEQQGKQVLARYGLPLPRFQEIRLEAEALPAAERIGYPAVLKILSPHLHHKTEAGGVILSLPDADGIREGVGRLKGRFPDLFQPGGATLLVEEMIGEGIEVLLGMTRDPHFGPLLVVGLGGILVEVLKDVAFARPPVSSFQAEALWRSLRGFPLLEGVRGKPAGDFPALIQATVDFSRMVQDLGDDFEAIEINPLLVLPKGRGVKAVDALFIAVEKTRGAERGASD